MKIKHDNSKTSWFYSNWYTLVLWITGVGILLGILYNITYGNEGLNFVKLLFPSIFNTLILWGGSMFIVAFCWKHFPWEVTPVKHLTLEILLIVLLLLVFICGMALYYSNKEQLPFSEVLQQNSGDILFTVLITFLIVTIHEAIYFYRQWKHNFSKSISLEKDNLEASYNALKAQVNPHFLFNSLNSLMTLIDNNPKAELYVQNLSEYLRYVLLSSEKREVTLSEELENLEKFFQLQHLRFNENLIVSIQIHPEVLHLKIPPLALQMLVDNCIKHNIISSNHPLKIEIEDHYTTITVRNNKQLKKTDVSTGQGLKNIEGRYRFITGEHPTIISDDKQFAVTIPLII
jgi:two-component system LytT family sensor kinase